VDVSVEILDGIIRGLQDMRAFLIETVDENAALREKLNTLKKVFGE
jgi:regulator of replication initiation timing